MCAAASLRHHGRVLEHATRVLAIRHGETAWNTESRIQGHTDIPLNDTGLWQAERVAHALRGESLQAVYSSDLQRARTTAQAIAQAQQLTLSLDPGLRERHFGHLEGLTHQEITARWPEQARRWRERDPAFGRTVAKPCRLSTTGWWAPWPASPGATPVVALPWWPMAGYSIVFTVRPTACRWRCPALEGGQRGHQPPALQPRGLHPGGCGR